VITFSGSISPPGRVTFSTGMLLEITGNYFPDFFVICSRFARISAQIRIVCRNCSRFARNFAQIWIVRFLGKAAWQNLVDGWDVYWVGFGHHLVEGRVKFTYGKGFFESPFVPVFLISKRLDGNVSFFVVGVGNMLGYCCVSL